MNNTFFSFGKCKTLWVRQGIEVYFKRLQHYLPSQWIELPAIAIPQSPNANQAQQIKEKESQEIQKRLSQPTCLICCSEKGKSMNTRELSQWIERQFHSGLPSMHWVIGGALGIDPGLQKQAQLTLSLSPLTFPHEMALLVLMEQVYRSMTIIRGEPYHNE